MKQWGLWLCLIGCGSSSSSGPDAASNGGPDARPASARDLPVPAEGFQIFTPDIEIAAGQEVTYRYITRYQGPEVGVKRWQSKMAQGSHHAILYFQPSTQVPDGTVEEGACLGAGIPQWMYSTQTPDNEAVMPSGVGMTVPTGTVMCVEMHYLNASDASIFGGVTINGEAYPQGTTYQRAAAYVTYNTQINIPPMSAGEAGGSCAVPSGAKFFGLSTHVHKQGTLTRVRDGAATLFESTDWEHPGTVNWGEPTFYEFSGTLDYHCSYQNNTTRTVTEGNSAEFDEMCMAVGYFFPATGPKFCINSDLIN